VAAAQLIVSLQRRQAAARAKLAGRLLSPLPGDAARGRARRPVVLPSGASMPGALLSAA